MCFAFKNWLKFDQKLVYGIFFSLFWNINGQFFEFYDNKMLNVVFSENKDSIF